MYQRLLHSYTTDADRYDELLAADGSLRPHWRKLFDQLQNLSPEMMCRRVDEMRDAVASGGMTYKNGDGPQGVSCPWKLDFLAQIIDPEEWEHLSVSIAQRARLLNAVLGDLYGAQKLLTDGLLPPALVFGRHGYLWPCHGLRPPGRVYLHLYAIDLARLPDGRWQVFADHTQDPSGVGYAQYNRQVMTQVLSDVLRDMHVQPVLNCLHTLQRSLMQLAPADDEPPLAVLLTPGRYHEAYPEQAFLARMLDFPLVEGTDLTVRADCVFLKTQSGLQRVHAIMRRIDDDYCDPLELRSDSALGVAGLTQAVRSGKVLIANALGSGVLESVALHGFLPAICRNLLGEELALPSAATWWCGEKKALEYTLAHMEKLVVSPVFPSKHMQSVSGCSLDEQGRCRLVESLQAQPQAYVAQERVLLSQAPVLTRGVDCRLTNRAITLRMFAVADGDGGYEIMPGGLCHAMPHRHPGSVSPVSGRSSKDVWVLGKNLDAAAVGA